MIGAPFIESAPSVPSGSAYVLDLVNEEWQFLDELTPSFETDIRCGEAVATVEDFVIIGCPLEDQSWGTCLQNFLFLNP